MKSISLVLIFLLALISLDIFAEAGPVQIIKRTRNKFWPCLVAAGSVTGLTLSKHCRRDQYMSSGLKNIHSSTIAKNGKSDGEDSKQADQEEASFQDLYYEDSFLDFNHKIINEHWKRPNAALVDRNSQIKLHQSSTHVVDEDNYFSDKVSIDDYFDYAHPNGFSILMKKAQPTGESPINSKDEKK